MKSVCVKLLKYKYHILVVLIGAVIVFRYALFGFVVGDGSDASREYQVYLALTSGNALDMGLPNLLLSCLMTTAVPAYLQRLTGIEAIILYKSYLCLIIAWLPLVVYLLARRFMADYMAFLVALLFMAQPYYLWSLSYARIVIAVMFFSLLILTLITDTKHKYWIIPVLALMIVLSHYGTTFIVLGLLSVWYIISLLQWGYLKWQSTNA